VATLSIWLSLAVALVALDPGPRFAGAEVAQVAF
jgi:hypothetical protein